MFDISIRPATPQDLPDITRIYNYYIRETVITFEEVEISAEEMGNRRQDVLANSFPWLVAERAGRVVGYAYAGKWRPRVAYRFAVESTVYLDPSQTGNGIGTLLYEALLADLSSRSLHTVLGGIALPNAASVALHERLGFVKVAHLKEVGFKFDEWIDVGYWQRML